MFYHILPLDSGQKTLPKLKKLCHLTQRLFYHVRAEYIAIYTMYFVFCKNTLRVMASFCFIS